MDDCRILRFSLTDNNNNTCKAVNTYKSFHLKSCTPFKQYNTSNGVSSNGLNLNCKIRCSIFFHFNAAFVYLHYDFLNVK